MAVDLDSPNCIEGSDNLLRLRWFDTRSQAPERIPVGITFRFDLFSIFFCSFPTYFFKMLFHEKARTCFGGVSFEVCSTHKQAYFMHFQLFLFRECFELILFGRLDRTYTKRLTSWIFRIIFVKLATVWMSRSPPEAAPLRLRLATLDAALRGIAQLSVI